MSSFTRFNTGLTIRFVGPHPTKHDVSLFRLLKGFDFYLEDNHEDVVKVPKGFITDGASIPRVLWIILPPWGSYGQAAVLHDYLIEGGLIVYKSGSYSVNRNQARCIFSDALKVLSIPNWKRRVIITGVWLWDKLMRRAW